MCPPFPSEGGTWHISEGVTRGACASPTGVGAGLGEELAPRLGQGLWGGPGERRDRQMDPCLEEA